MNVALWIVQGLLGGMFIMAGFVKSTQSKEKLAVKMPWVNDFSLTQVKLIGLSQLLAGLGLILPWLTGIATFLTPVAALGLGLVMISAAIYHLRKNEMKEIGVNLFILSLALFVAVGRFMS